MSVPNLALAAAGSLQRLHALLCLEYMLARIMRPILNNLAKVPDMRLTKEFAILFGTLGLAVQAAHASEMPADKKFVSVTEQRTAIVDCKYELGRGGWPKLQATYVETPWGGQAFLRILPGQLVSAEDAKWINACADKRLGRNSQALLAKPLQQPSGFCPKHAPVMYGGTRYCIKSH